MSDHLNNFELIEHVCEVLRRYAMDAKEADENDDLIFEADYAMAILEHPALAPTTPPADLARGTNDEETR